MYKWDLALSFYSKQLSTACSLPAKVWWVIPSGDTSLCPDPWADRANSTWCSNSTQHRLGCSRMLPTFPLSGGLWCHCGTQGNVGFILPPTLARACPHCGPWQGIPPQVSPWDQGSSGGSSLARQAFLFFLWSSFCSGNQSSAHSHRK